MRLHRRVRDCGGFAPILICRKHIVGALLFALSPILLSSFCSNTVSAVATQSTLTMTVVNTNLSMVFFPTPSGTFDKSSNTTINVTTDNFTGYTLTIASETSTSLLNNNEDAIESITQPIDELTFSSSSVYNNKWGYKPSHYVSNNTVVQNSNYLPAPSTLGDIIDVTSAANSTNNTYTLSFGARISYGIPADTYTGSLVITAVANTIVYNVTYDKNTSETVTSMPVPNPQALELAGGTPVANSHGTLDSSIPIMTTGNPIMTFGGWCDTTTTINSTTHNYECSGTTYQAGDDYPIDQTADGTNITLYAIWLEDPFPMVFSQMGKCVFNNGTISGSECQKYVNDHYIDTEVALYSNDNYQLDYEVHFTIDTYNPNSQSDSQATMFNDKLSSSVTGSPYGGKSPGIVVRNTSSKYFEIKSTYGAPTDHAESRDVVKTPVATAYAGTDVRIFRIDGVIYTSVDNGPLVFLQDYTSFNQQFGLTAWFGAYPDNVDCTENCTAAKRYFTGELSDMYIKLGDIPTGNILDITYNANGGTPSTTVYKIINGNALEEFPEVTNSGWLFDGWWTASSGGQQVTTATVPSTTTTYYAHWYKSVADAQITNTSVSMSVNDTETITITNVADIEPYTLTSSNTSVATVNSSGVITAVSNGTATITLTGTKTGDTRTINVTVGSLIYVDFDSQGGTPSSYTEPVAGGGSFSSLPEPTRSGYTLEGWYTGTNGTGTKLTTSTVFDSNTPTQYYAHWEESTYVCKIAEAGTLHTETCSQTGSNGCKGASLPSNTITYGSIVDSTTFVAGNAFNCDINYDGDFDDENERFYYFGTENGNAKFVYFQSMQTTSSTYDVALGLLPTSSDPGWDNPNLVTFSGDYNGSVARFMTYPEAHALCDNTDTGIGVQGKCIYLLEKSAFANTTITDGIWLEKQPNNANRIQTRSRGITHTNPTGTTSNAARPTIEVPIEYVEPYIEPVASHTITFNPHNGDSTFTETVTAGSSLGNKYPSPDPTYTNYVFQGWYTAASGGTLVTAQTEPDGDWTYHAQWKGSVALAQVQYNSISIVEGNTATVQVTNAADIEAFTCSSSDTTVATVNASTCEVTAVDAGTATISLYGTGSQTTRSDIVTITVLDASTTFRVTFDPQNGDSTFYRDVAAGQSIDGLMPQNPTYTNHAFQRWYDTSNNQTVTSATEPLANMTVNAEWKLDVTQAVISNDMILAVGDQITIVVGNAAQLESYTFSSGNSLIATVDANTGVVTGVGVGTTNITMTGTQSNLTKTFAVEVTTAPVVKRTVTFNANGGSTPSPAASWQVDDGDQVGSLPTTSRTNYRFFGWYTDDGTFYEEVTPETTVDADVTYYARWVEDTTSFPIVFAEINECEFNGNAVISGTYCTQDKTKKYVDSGVALFTSTSNNYQKDFEIGFTITELANPQTVNQGTLVNSKYENSNLNYPGFVFRSLSTGPNFELTGRFSNGTTTAPTFTGSSLHRVRIVRESGVLKYSINDGALTTWFDANSNTHRFDTTVWFGASATSGGSPQRYLTGKLTDMYVKLGQPTDYAIEFNPGNGSFTNSSDANRTVTAGSALGSLPVPNPPSSSFSFIGWFDESTSPATQVTALTEPSSSMTYVAHYSYVSSDEPVEFDVSNNATRGYQNLISTWVASPIGISTFHKASPINSSTWGDTSELSELEFWNGIRSNFINNECLIKTNSSYNTNSDATKPLTALSAWTSGTVDCSKPDAYDTLIGAPLTVRLDDDQGAVVSYAKADSGVIHNMIPGQTYYWEKTGDSTVHGYVTAKSNGSSTGTRWVDAGVIRNARDLGGLPVTYTDSNEQTVTGTLAYGRIFRGEKLQNAPATELTNLGITTEYNVGDNYSSDTHLTDYQPYPVIHYNFNYNSGDEQNSNSNYMKAWDAVTSIMTDITNTNTTKNVYIHCRVGADRTGTIAYLLEGLLGVPDEYRYQEYELTNLSGLYDRTRYYKEKVGGSTSPTIKFVYMMDYVETAGDIYNWYMQNPNADEDLIQAFRTAMTVTSGGGRGLQNNAPAQNRSLSSQSLNLNNQVENIDENVLNGSSDGSGSYSEPLGETHEVIPENAGVSSATALVAVAALTAISGASLLAVAGKQNDS